jgi:hypothetical protein
MNKKIIEASELPLEEQVYLKKDIFGWRIVNPVKDAEGNWLWNNFLFGGARNLFMLLLMLIIIFGFIWIYNHDMAEMQEVVEDPCSFCSSKEMNSVLSERYNAVNEINSELYGILIGV